MNNNKIITRNKNSLPINFCTTGNFLNINKIKFIPIDKSLKVNNSKKANKKNSSSNISETILKQEENTDELIKKLKERIIFLENKIKILESEKEINNKSIKNSHNKTFISKINSLNKSSHKNNNKVTTIPLDKNLLKTKLNNRKKNFFELFGMNKKSIYKKNRSNSFNISMSKPNNSKNNSNNTINNSLSNCLANNNSCSGSGHKSKKKSINLINKSNSLSCLNNLLFFISAKIAKSKESSSIDHRKKKSLCLEKKSSIAMSGGRKINAIPKKGRKNFNASPKMMMSSTNYSNNISNSFKNDINLKNFSPKKVIDNSSFCDKNSLTLIKNKLENIKKRTKNLLGFYSSISIDNNGIYQINNNSSINNENSFTNYSLYTKINKLDSKNE
jgi:hypothetical protein